MQKISFDYFRGIESEQYSFYRIPKILFTAECFKGLSCEAKVLYGLLLDRMSLSAKNRWLDEQNRVYIIFTVEDIAELMNCGTQKAVKLLKELDTEKGIGLIEKRRLGLGKPNVIFVKNFVMSQNEDKKEPEKFANTKNCENHNSRVVETTIQESTEAGSENTEKYNLGVADTTIRAFPESQFKNDENYNSEIVKTIIQESPESQFKNGENHNSGMMKTTIQEFPESQFKNDENHNSRIVKTTIQEFPESQFKNDENHNSGMMKITTLEFPKSLSNKTDINNTDNSETEVPISSNLTHLSGFRATMPRDMIDEMEAYRETIRENISYECFQRDRQCHLGEIDELVELMVEVMLMSDNSILRIAGADKPAVIVKNRFMKITHGHIQYTLECLQKNTTKVGNIKAYLLTTLYNSTLTIGNYYQAEVNYDMYGGG
ncbi:replication initiator protein A [Blautia schinkii]|nr:replication initiator protein A [Blautia schinkii]